MRTDQVPVADGGDGTVDAAVAAGYQRIDVPVSGPTGEPVTAAFAIRGDVAVVEAAQACGLRRLPGGRLRPLTATSYGVGQLIGAAADAGARHIVLGLGGSATTDGGAGLITALGGRLLAADGGPVASGGAALAGLRELDPPACGTCPGWTCCWPATWTIPCSAPTGQRRSTARGRA